MQKFESSLKITSFDQKKSQEFFKKLQLFGGQYSSNLLFKGSKIIKKKNTILRSPHKHKKARDQLEIQHCWNFFKIKSNFQWLFFILYFKKYNNSTVSLDYKHFYEQTIFYI